MSATTIQTSKPNIGVFTNPNHDLYIAECEPKVDDLEPGVDEVTVQVRATGICGSDVHFQKEGQIGETMVVRDEHILGHESAGVIIAVHPSNKTFKVGDRVALEPGEPCYKCNECLHGMYNGCADVKFKSTPPYAGQLRRFLKHPSNLCHKIGDMSFSRGALLEPISVSLVAVDKAGVGLGDAVLICGAGPIGLISAMCARAAGAEPLVITDIDQSRLDFAKKKVPGIRTVLVERGDSPHQIAKKVISAAGDVKPRVCIECTGVESSVSAGIYSLAFGGLIQIVGVGKDFQTVPFMHLSVNEITIKYQYRYANSWPRAIRLVEGGHLEVDDLVTHKFKLEEGVEAFKKVATPGSVKVMITDEE